MPELLSAAGLTPFGADEGQLTGIQPVATAAWALVDLDPAFGAEIVAVELDTIAPGTFAFTTCIHDDPLIRLNVQKRLASGLIFFVHTVQFKSVEPDTTAAALAHINFQTTHLGFGKLVEASWTFHELRLAQIDSQRYKFGMH